MKTKTILAVLGVILLSGLLRAQIPQLINYQGRVAVDSVNFEGTGQFKFALVNTDGNLTYWSNDGTSAGGSEPAAAVPLPVTKGLYSLQLGDGVAFSNMIPIPSNIFTSPDLRLRVWFDDGVHGFQLLAPDQRLAPAVYLADGAVTNAAIAPGSVTGTSVASGSLDGTNIAAGSLGVNLLNAPAAPNPGQVLGFDGNNFVWQTAATGNSVFSLNGTNAYYNSGNVGLGTIDPLQKLTVKTDTGNYGFAHTDGTTAIGSYVGGSSSGAAGGWLGTLTDDPLHLFVNGGQPSLTIDRTGSVIIGATSSSSYKMLVYGASKFFGDSWIYGNRQIYGNTWIEGSTFVDGYWSHTGDSNISGDSTTWGNVSIYGEFSVSSWSTGSQILAVSPALLNLYGNANKSMGGTSWGVLSDQRLKQDIRSYEPGLDEILRLRPVRFRYRDGIKQGLTSDHEEIGFIAQEVQQVIPEAVTQDGEGYLGLQVDPIHWAAINAIRELNAKLEEQRRENAELKKKLVQQSNLSQRLDRLEERIRKVEAGATK